MTDVVRLSDTVTKITLTPQARAYALYAYMDGQAQPCPPAASSVEVTPPDSKPFIVVKSSMAPCDRMPGLINVTPIAATAVEARKYF